MYKCDDIDKDIFQVNLHSIKKKYFLNYWITFEYEAMIVHKVLGDELNKENIKPIPLSN